MKVPNPKLVGDHWECDFRPEFSWHTRVGPASLSREDAIHGAYARLAELRRERLAEPGAQLELRAGVPATFAAAVDAWQAVKGVRRADSARYVKTYAKQVRAELGAYLLSEFVDGGGQLRLVKYVNNLLAEGLAARTIRNRLSVVGQVLVFCTDLERRWLPFVPRLPVPPSLPPPRFEWIEEATFRALRASLYAPGVELDSLRAWLARPANRRQGPAELFVARRRVYLSWLFYTGVRTADANHLTGNDVGLDIGVYVRRARKTDVAPAQFELPEPLILDLREYLAVVGREFFLSGERIGGGRWNNVSRLLQRAARILGVGPVNPRILRRSYARKMFQLGYEIKDVAERMGHADLRMLNEIYVQTPRPSGRARSLWRATVSRTPQSGGAPGVVVAFPSARDLKKG